ncbi:hypothetical protein MmiEs2_14240 [Methanimicrococcus stummii]|uniref:Phospholipase D-like domain-containing protein n=1 Tax=Methanimicrococcus stummii TaxID=3028294 RepID=A0AA96VBJ2_9EURY|nr:phospholipase D family protein [Methanimicrococcus sp. Es2]WNY29200.1 hypothetical protein MmiEs2_14240 [Methanimicrococcus sp. Es2]
MVKLIDTQHCSAELSDLVKKAQKEIILVSPYLQISPRFLDLLKEASLRNISITLIYRDDKLKEKDSKQLSEQKSKFNGLNVKIAALENLHAKCYLNESKAIITSMNLYQFSQENNIEFGVRVLKESDPELYDEVYTEIQRIYKISQFDREIPVAPVVAAAAQSKGSKIKSSKSAVQSDSESKSSSKNNFADLIPFFSNQDCYCIRCKSKFEDKFDKPLCKKCYSSWTRYKNEDFAEKYCFSCGEENETTFAKPICRKCYRSKVKSKK